MYYGKLQFQINKVVLLRVTTQFQEPCSYVLGQTLFCVFHYSSWFVPAVFEREGNNFFCFFFFINKNFIQGYYLIEKRINDLKKIKKIKQI